MTKSECTSFMVDHLANVIPGITQKPLYITSSNLVS